MGKCRARIQSMGHHTWPYVTPLNDFWHKREIYNFDPLHAFLSIATNIPVLLMTVLSSRITYMCVCVCKCIYVCVYIYICMYVYIYIYVCMCIYIYIYI